MLSQHEEERISMDDQLEKIDIPKIKYSSALLNDRFKLKQLIKIRDYAKAKELKEIV